MPGREIMLKKIGLERIDQLFSDIPDEAKTELDFPSGICETELISLFKQQASKNKTAMDMPCFLGGDIQPRYIPSALQHILSRGELLTAYTSYQPEISQGMLQALFEYQSLMVELTGMDVVNASMYDTSTALGEALRLSTRINRKSNFLLPSILCPSKKNVAQMYIDGYGGTISYYNVEQATGEIDINDIKEKKTENTSAVYVETPNALGVLDRKVISLKEELGNTLLIAGVDPLTLSITREPGSYGADIVIGEGQSLGLPMGFGGPTLGLFATRKEHARKMPGRLIGATHTASGERGFCITLQTREQHIRREKATSNICSNEALCALGAGAYVALLGNTGMKRIASLLLENAHALAKRIAAVPGFEAPPFKAPFFNSFTVKSPIDYEKIHKHLLSKGIHGGSSLESILGEKNMALFSVNENITPESYHRLIEVLQEIEGWGC